jgi:ABC-type molybdenum transport system ATPase subunit/photorepair protein PhrA
MSNTDFLLAIEDLTVSFDGFKAIDALNLYLERGELRVVIGPNGAGKTTLLDLICGKTRATAGSIKFKQRGDDASGGTRRVRRHRPQVPDAVDLREPECSRTSRCPSRADAACSARPSSGYRGGRARARRGR